MLPPSQLLKIGFTPTLRDFNNFLLFLYRKQRFNAIIHLFYQLSSNEIGADAQTLTIFAKASLKENKYGEAALFLKALPVNSRVAHQNRFLDSLLQGICAFNHDPETGFSLLKHFLKTNGFLPSSRTFCLLILCFSKLGKMSRVIDLLELMSADKLNYPFDNFVCSSVISGFSRIGEFELAIRFYENAVKSGNLVPNIVTCTAVVHAYCKLGETVRVSDLVAWMKKNNLPFDVVFYTNWMHGCLTEGLIHEAFKKFRAMVDRKIKLDIISYTVLIDGFSKEGNVEKAVGLLHRMRRDGVEPNVVTYTSIILGFCKKGKLDEAFAVFGMVKRLGIEADEFIYAVLIDGVCRIGNFDLVFELLDEMVKKGVNPSAVTYNTVINGLCRVGRTVEADDLSKGIDRDVVTYTMLLYGYIREESAPGIFEMKRRVEESGVTMDIVMCNVLIKAMLMVGLFDNAFDIYKGLMRMNLLANSVTYYTLIDGSCRAGRIDEALEIFDDFRKASNSSAACYNCIISGLCRKGLLDMAINLLIEYIRKGFPLNRMTCKLLIEATMQNKGLEGVLKLIYRLEQVRLRELHDTCNDSISFLCKMGYSSILKWLLFEGEISLGRLILPLFVKSYGMFDIEVSRILLFYLCLRDVKKALIFISMKEWIITIPVILFRTLMNNDRVLDVYELLVGAKNHLPSMDVSDYSIMVDALCKASHIDKALNLCSLAKKNGVALNIIVYNSVINGLCHQGCLVEAFRLYDSLERIGVNPTVVTYGTLIDALVREGLLHDARMLFERMLVKDLDPGIHIYNSLINGYCKASRLDEAMNLFHDLEGSLEPNGFTVAALINGYCQKGDMEGALKLFYEFKGKGLLPDFQGFVYLVRGLCTKGRMEESRSVLREMLRTQSAVEILDWVGLEIESDSVGNQLMFLCEQGRMDEAATVLDEVKSMLVSTRKNSYTSIDPLLLSESGIDNEEVEKIGGSEDGTTGPLKDFDSFYSVIHSLCLEGNLGKANRLTKMLMGL